MGFRFEYLRNANQGFMNKKHKDTLDFRIT